MASRFLLLLHLPEISFAWIRKKKRGHRFRLQRPPDFRRRLPRVRRTSFPGLRRGSFRGEIKADSIIHVFNMPLSIGQWHSFGRHYADCPRRWPLRRMSTTMNNPTKQSWLFCRFQLGIFGFAGMGSRIVICFAEYGLSVGWGPILYVFLPDPGSRWARLSVVRRKFV